MPQSVRQRRGNDGRHPIHPIPSRNSNRLLGATIPLVRNDAEERKASCLEQSQEEARSQQPGVVMACSHRRLCDPPSQDEAWHKDAMRHFDNQDGRERLPC
jgi:hypothetical protein